VLEYCNEGDMYAYIKRKKNLTEDKAVEFLVQMLNGFKTLVKNKILHQDLKLAKILLHNGQIKIADFGFDKLVLEGEYANTVLGSPLNKAPEVINGKKYNNKADVYSMECVYMRCFLASKLFEISDHPSMRPSHLIGKGYKKAGHSVSQDDQYNIAYD
jgi:serine/threonine-protein kinase ULK/ATG1